MSRPSGRKSDWVAWSKRQNASRCYFCGRLEGLLVIMCVLFCDLIAVFNIHNTCTVEISTCKLADLLRVVFQRRDPLRFHQQFFEALSFGVFDRMSAERWSKNSNRWRTGGKRVGCWLENELKMEFSSCHPDCCMKLRRCEMLVIVYIYIYMIYVIIAVVWWCILMIHDMLCKTNINSITEPTAPRDSLKVTSKERLIYCINTRTFMQKTGREDEHYEFRWGQDKIPEQEPLNCECNTLTTSPPRSGGDCSKKHCAFRRFGSLRLFRSSRFPRL